MDSDNDTIDPRLLATKEMLYSLARSEFDDREDFLDGLEEAESFQSTEPHEQCEQRPLHPLVEETRNEATRSQYFLNKGIFSEEQKAIIQRFSSEPPSSVMERLKDRDPALPHTYRQVKGAVENERRKKNRRQSNGPWTEEEMEFLRQNLQKAPRELTRALQDGVAGCTKNVDQVRDMKSQLVQKAKSKVR